MPNILEEVRLTADDAIISKMSCVDLGYYSDSYIHNFIKRHAKRSPLLNRGYYSRIAAIETVVSRFIRHYNRECQIISLGAGYDTLLFRLHDMDLLPKMFVDLDLEETCVNKATIIRNKEELSRVIYGDSLFDVKSKSPIIRTDNYILQPMDLTDLQSMKSFFSEDIIQNDFPTLLLSECVFIYIDPDVMNQTLQFLQQQLPNSAVLVYEMIRPHDPFGRTMMNNFHERGCDLVSMNRYPDLLDHVHRYQQIGYIKWYCKDMLEVYSTFLEKSEIKRISRIEMFDEFEEWEMIQKHYCFLVVAQGSFEQWFQELMK